MLKYVWYIISDLLVVVTGALELFSMPLCTLWCIFITSCLPVDLRYRWPGTWHGCRCCSLSVSSFTPCSHSSTPVTTRPLYQRSVWLNYILKIISSYFQIIIANTAAFFILFANFYFFTYVSKSVKTEHASKKEWYHHNKWKINNTYCVTRMYENPK